MNPCLSVPGGINKYTGHGDEEQDKNGGFVLFSEQPLSIITVYLFEKRKACYDTVRAYREN